MVYLPPSPTLAQAQVKTKEHEQLSHTDTWCSHLGQKEMQTLQSDFGRCSTISWIQAVRCVVFFCSISRTGA